MYLDGFGQSRGTWNAANATGRKTPTLLGTDPLIMAPHTRDMVQITDLMGFPSACELGAGWSVQDSNLCHMLVGTWAETSSAGGPIHLFKACLPGRGTAVLVR